MNKNLNGTEDEQNNHSLSEHENSEKNHALHSKQEKEDSQEEHPGQEDKDDHGKHTGVDERIGHEEHVKDNERDPSKDLSSHKESTGHEEHDSQQEKSGHQEHDDQGDHSGHEGHAAHSPEMFRKRFWVTLILTIPVLIYSHHIQMWLRFSPPHFPGSSYIPFVLGTVIFFYGGSVFLKGGWDEITSRRPGMMTLISLAITVAFTYSLLVTFGLPGEELYWELATLVAVMLLGHWVEMNAVQGAQGALKEMARLLPDKAWLITDSGEKEVPVSSLKTGDLILIRPGAQVPADGKVTQGETRVNEAMLTGESSPIPKKSGDQVIAGSVNQGGSLRVKVENIGEETVLAGIMRLVEQAQSSRSRAQFLADRAAFWLVLIALTAAGITALAWGITPAQGTFVMERVVTVLVAACPHALGLAIPLVIAISTYLSARNGLLVKDRLALEEARSLNCVVFDKTGTLTRGEQGVVGIYPASGHSEDRVLELAAAAEADSEHMISRGILKSAREREITIPKVSDFQALAGRGVKARLDGQDIYVGGPNLLDFLELKADPSWDKIVEEANNSGQSTVFVIEDHKIVGIILIADVIREESQEAVKALKNRGIQVVMLTGDSHGVAKKVSEELGIERYFAGVLPQHKASKIEQLQQEGYKTAMVGDGINDAPALAVADVGIAIGAGTDVAVESAGIVLVKNDPRDVVKLIHLSSATYKKMIQNLVWAAGYNVAIIPLAAGVLAPIGFILPMAVGAMVMSASTVIVALNAQLLRRLDLSNFN